MRSVRCTTGSTAGGASPEAAIGVSPRVRVRWRSNRGVRIRTKRAWPLLAWLVLPLAGGCIDITIVQSLHPLYSDHTAVFDSTLCGRWAMKGNPDSTTWEVRKEADHYRLIWADTGDFRHPMEYDARLVRLSNHEFLDLSVPEESGDVDYVDSVRNREVPGFALCPVHFLLGIQRTGGGLEVSSLDDQWIESVIKSGPTTAGAAFFLNEGSLLLTLDTPQLQQFVSSLSEDKGLSTWGGTWVRTPFFHQRRTHSRHPASITKRT